MAATGTWIGPTYYEDALATIIDLANNTGTGFSNVPDEVFTSTSAMASWLAGRGVYTNIIGNNVTWNQTPTASVTQVLNPANSSSTVTATTQPTVMQQVSADSTAKTITTQPFRPNGLLTFAQTAGQAVTAASVGIFLGKKIDETLYNLNPDFWDANGMSSLDPTTWSTITNGEDSLGNALFNYVFGIDPQTNETQAYIDQDAFAYMAMWLNSMGALSGMYVLPEYVTTGTFQITALPSDPIDFMQAMGLRTATLNSVGAYCALSDNVINQLNSIFNQYIYQQNGWAQSCQGCRQAWCYKKQQLVCSW